MQMIEIAPLSNGAHRNQTAINDIPSGWAVVPDELVIENFPFGTVEVAEIGGVMTVTEWIAGVMPTPIVPVSEPTEREDMSAMIVDHEFRLTMLELGVE